MDLAQATKVTDAVLEMRGVNRWFLQGTRERLIEAAWRNTTKEAVADQFEEILSACEMDDPNGDPCDEVNTWAMWQRWAEENGLQNRRGFVPRPTPGSKEKS
jgi:hypothetical protein